MFFGGIHFSALHTVIYRSILALEDTDGAVRTASASLCTAGQESLRDPSQNFSRY